MLVPVYFEVESEEDARKLQIAIARIPAGPEFFVAPTLDGLTLEELADQLAVTEED